MIGYAHPGGAKTRAAVFRTGSIATYYGVPEDALSHAIEKVETSDHPEVLLLQAAHPYSEVHATAIYSSVWSNSYRSGGFPYGRVWRDFHYQVMFVAMASLVEMGCDCIRMDPPKTGFRWERDAYICFLEAVRTLRKELRPGVSVQLQEESYDPKMRAKVESCLPKIVLEEHRIIGMHPYVFEGLNMRRVFVSRNTGPVRASNSSTTLQ